MDNQIIIGGIRFNSKADAIAQCRAILYRDKMGTEILGEDRVFVSNLLKARPDKLKELRGRTIVRFLRKMHRHNTPCFFAELDDGTLLDFSFMKVINAYPEPVTALA
jgi:hypothetical protein